MDRKRMTAGGLAPTVVLVIALALVVSGQPVKDENKLTNNIACKRDRVVANIQGYVEFVGQNYTRQLLDFTDVEQTIYKSEPEKKYLTLTGEQFAFYFAYVHEDKGTSEGHYQFSSIFMGVRNPSYSISTYSVRCNFEEEFTVALPDESRYSCTKEQTHRCSWHDRLVANVVLRSFELELDGNPDKVAKLEFSKPAWGESCEQWTN